MELSLVNDVRWHPHPNYPEVQFEVEKLDDATKMEYFSEFQKYTHAVVLKDPDSGEILYEVDPITDARKPMLYEVTRLPFESMVKFLLKAIKNWKGLENKGVPYSINEKNMRLLWNKKLNLIEKDAVEVKDKDGNVTGKKDKVTPCWQWVNSLAMDDDESNDPIVKP